MTPTLLKELRTTKETIKTEIREAVTGKRTPADTAKKLTETADIDTVKWILAETVKNQDWDGRYSRPTKQWAQALYIPVLHGEDGSKYGLLDGPHPAHINQLVEAIINF